MTRLTFMDYAIAKENGISKEMLRNRVYNYGWDRRRARTETPKEPDPWGQKAKANGISIALYYNRVKRGWSKEDASTIPPKKTGRPQKGE